MNIKLEMKKYGFTKPDCVPLSYKFKDETWNLISFNEFWFRFHNSTRGICIPLTTFEK